jgi:hypothetical protein
MLLVEEVFQLQLKLAIGGRRGSRDLNHCVWNPKPAD